MGSTSSPRGCLLSCGCQPLPLCRIGTLLTITTDTGRVFRCGGATNQPYTPYTSQGGDKPSDSSDAESSEGDDSDASDVPEGGNSTARSSPGVHSRRHLLADVHRASKRSTMLRYIPPQAATVAASVTDAMFRYAVHILVP